MSLQNNIDNFYTIFSNTKQGTAHNTTKSEPQFKLMKVPNGNDL